MGGTSPSTATKGPCDITLPPAVMSEATTMDLPRQMAGDGVVGDGAGMGLGHLRPRRGSVLGAVPKSRP